MKTYSLSRIAIILSFMILAQNALAICAGNAVVVAEPTSDPDQPAWTYTVSITWTYVSGVHHWIIPLDPPDGSCVCDDFTSALTIPTPIGTSNGLPDGCTVPYFGQLECDGDPNSNLVGTFLVFTPDLSEDCELGVAGVGVFQFHSDLPPAPITEGFNFFAVSNQQSCGMSLTGVFPSMGCNPVGVEDASWGAIKSFYR